MRRFDRVGGPAVAQAQRLQTTDYRHRMHSDLVSQLGYALGKPNAARTAVQRVVATRGFTALNTRVLHRADRWALQATGGRTTLTSALAGLPVIFLTTTGARSGLPRTAPLIGIPHHGSLAVIGSNFGSSNHPGWVHNLVAHPFGEVRYRDRSARIEARQAAGDEHDAIWITAQNAYPGYGKYQEWAAARSIRIFVLDPATA